MTALDSVFLRGWYGLPARTVGNALIALRGDPLLRGRFSGLCVIEHGLRFERPVAAIMPLPWHDDATTGFRTGPCWRCGRDIAMPAFPRLIEERERLQLRAYLECVHQLVVSDRTLHDALRLIASECPRRELLLQHADEVAP